MTDIRPFCMPKWGIEMTEGTIAEWMIDEGQAFTRGQTLCLIETAKITNEVEAEFDLVLRRRLVEAGSEAHPVGTLLGIFGDAGASDAEIDAFIAAFRPANTAVTAQPADKPAPADVPADAPAKINTNRAISREALRLAEAEGVDIDPISGSGRNGRITHQDVVRALRGPASPALRGPAVLPDGEVAIYASPLARRLAAMHGIDLSSLTGTGPRGRIAKADVLARARIIAHAREASIDAGHNPPTIEPMDKIRKLVARKVTETKRDVPHFYLRMTVDIDALLALRKTANLVLGTKASLNDYLVRAVALALVRHPGVNIQVHGDNIHRFARADVAIAVAAPSGLVMPVIRSADLMRIDQIAAASRALIDKAGTGRLSYADMDGGTFSISNLGMFGIDQFDAIINAPQGAILAIGAAARAPMERADNSLGFATRLALSLSVDHRAIDGAAAARFMATLRELIESPEALFA
ncbi:2-oxo acid dehydrogenase subunit E2 [Sphingomonas sp.]|uniref:2-oxo acid dehydrogenase subunit E2 n=1 Tax=Sphingomonas sp. TaxID=28214 RepID=UPI0025D38354|nr:2-oxo acid dehydrogenase subunit E2 [Sphingomonas sp.]